MKNYVKRNSLDAERVAKYSVTQHCVFTVSRTI